MSEQLVLAVEVMIERALSELGLSCDVIHGDAGIAAPTKELVRPVDDPLACLVCRMRHDAILKVYSLVNLHGYRPD
jgi:hypothetical protein